MRLLRFLSSATCIVALAQFLTKLWHNNCGLNFFHIAFLLACHTLPSLGVALANLFESQTSPRYLFYPCTVPNHHMVRVSIWSVLTFCVSSGVSSTNDNYAGLRDQIMPPEWLLRLNLRHTTMEGDKNCDNCNGKSIYFRWMNWMRKNCSPNQPLNNNI